MAKHKHKGGPPRESPDEAIVPLPAEHGFLSAIKATPADDTARVVYADWLDEAAAESCYSDNRRAAYAARAALIRKQVYAKINDPKKYKDGDGYDTRWRNLLPATQHAALARPGSDSDQHNVRWRGLPSHVTKSVVDRGLISEVRFDSAEWAKENLDKLTRDLLQPVTRLGVNKVETPENAQDMLDAASREGVLTLYVKECYRDAATSMLRNSDMQGVQRLTLSSLMEKGVNDSSVHITPYSHFSEAIAAAASSPYLKNLTGLSIGYRQLAETPGGSAGMRVGMTAFARSPNLQGLVDIELPHVYAQELARIKAEEPALLPALVTLNEQPWQELAPKKGKPPGGAGGRRGGGR